MSDTKSIARERMEILLELAKGRLKSDRTLSKRYVHLARLIGMRYNIPLPARWKPWLCKECGYLLAPGINCTVRISRKGSTHRLIVCGECGAERRRPLSPRQHGRKQRL